MQARRKKKKKKENPYPYTREDVIRFFSDHESFQVCYIKIERSFDNFGHYVCELILQAGEKK